MLKKLMLTFLFGAVMFGAMKGFGFAVELALGCAAVIALLVSPRRCSAGRRSTR